MTEISSAPLRIGCIKYLNAQPLIHGWDGALVLDHPATLCAMLANAELDVALVSSFEFLQRPVYTIVDNVAVASPGEVYSVFVAHCQPLRELREIALDPASRTSVNLLRCLAAERQLDARLVPEDGNGIGCGRARLLIGDQAIQFRARHGSTYEYWDLATAWRETTGLPFVFALWLIRPGLEQAGVVADKLRKLRDNNLADLDSVIAAQQDFAPEFSARYLRECLRYTFGDAEKEGLLKFRSLCEKHGILPPQAEPLRLV